MTRTLTLAGYAVIAAAMLATQLTAVVAKRVPSLTAVLRLLAGRRLGRIVLTVAWLWLGWHLFVRVDRS